MGAAVDANTHKYVEYSGICLRVGTGAHLSVPQEPMTRNVTLNAH